MEEICEGHFYEGKFVRVIYVQVNPWEIYVKTLYGRRKSLGELYGKVYWRSLWEDSVGKHDGRAL